MKRGYKNERKDTNCLVDIPDHDLENVDLNLVVTFRI